VHGRHVTFSRILVRLDGTPEAAIAIPLACAVARVTQASITLVRVLADDEWSMIEEAEEGLRASARELGCGDVPIDTVVCQHDPAHEILGQVGARRADLLVCEPRARRPASRRGWQCGRAASRQEWGAGAARAIRVSTG
jgi:nucleotide-binding universal stress UspA family protein